MKKFIVAVSLVLLIGGSVGALDFEDLTDNPMAFSPTTYDARARAMGHTGILSATGANSIFYNPAQLAMITHKSIELGGRIDLIGSISDDGSTADEKYKMHAKITDLSFGMPIKVNSPDIKVAGGIGYNTYFDYGGTYESEFTNTESDPNYTRTYELKSHGGLTTLSPAVAASYQEKYFLGVAINIPVMSKWKENSENTYNPDPFDGNGTGEQEATLGGTFLVIGAAAKATPELTFGVMFRPGFTMKLTDAKYTSTNASGTSSGTDGDSEGDVKPVFGIAASYQVSPKVLVVGEFQTRGFADIEIVDYPSSGTGDPSYDTLTAVKNGNCLRAGMEYTLESSVVRLGLFNESILVRDDSEAEKESPNSLTGITAGAGYTKDKITIDGFIEYGWWKYQYMDMDFSVDPPVTKTYDYKVSHLSLGFSVSYAII